MDILNIPNFVYKAFINTFCLSRYIEGEIDRNL